MPYQTHYVFQLTSKYLIYSQIVDTVLQVYLPPAVTANLGNNEQWTEPLVGP